MAKSVSQKDTPKQTKWEVVYEDEESEKSDENDDR